jgi:hypothetical protein
MKSIVSDGVIMIPTHVENNFDFYLFWGFLIFLAAFWLAVGSSYLLSRSGDASVGFIVCMTLTALGLVLLCIISLLYYISPGLEIGNKA